MNRVRSRLVCITSYDARIFQVCSQLLSSEKTLRGEAQGSCQIPITLIDRRSTAARISEA